MIGSRSFILLKGRQRVVAGSAIHHRAGHASSGSADADNRGYCKFVHRLEGLNVRRRRCRPALHAVLVSCLSLEGLRANQDES
jgi:hypothetical protein